MSLIRNKIDKEYLIMLYIKITDQEKGTNFSKYEHLLAKGT